MADTQLSGVRDLVGTIFWANQDLGSPSRGSRGMAESAGVPIGGKDFKTGQTLVKTILAPGLKARLLGVEGWFSTNILGNRDGEVLDDPESFRSKEITKAGVLDQILTRLAEFSEKTENIKSRIKEALTYPTLVLFFAAAILTFIMLVVVPKFNDIFETFDQELPLPTRMLKPNSLNVFSRILALRRTSFSCSSKQHGSL